MVVDPLKLVCVKVPYNVHKIHMLLWNELTSFILDIQFFPE